MATSPPASVCAGLRQTLLHGWQQGFPVQPSPFQVLAQRTGGTLREVLGQCQQMQRNGALQGVQVQWGEPLRRVRWRCGLWAPEAELEAAGRAAAALPACVLLERVEAAVPDLPSLWLELEALRSEVIESQLQTLALRWRLGPRLSLQHAAPCHCHEHLGPCCDEPLAQALERGLPLVAHPYQELALKLQRSERQVLARLRDWIEGGDVQTLSLAAPHQPHRQSWALAAVEVDPTPALLARLRELSATSELRRLPRLPDWPFGLFIGMAAPQELTGGALDPLLQAAGLAQAPMRRWLARRWAPRVQARLFA
ncbi:hypothetical protein HNQ51_002217 [Inhella inkyongensis]|uniref:Siroheme decarboxylase NirL-like HTH domain-containing protein n=1 Tax=Inhella inkyongensis TaxID=392593 RepID=A0A840S5W5_9BURK|nr:hypothetical protein [Inhella inkyongensis]MBB5204898.1 hypothetical protein [Inhella inkyongensis]